MAIMEYQCKECNAKEEILIHYTDAPTSLPCNECSGKMYRCVSAMSRTSRKWAK